MQIITLKALLDSWKRLIKLIFKKYQKEQNKISKVSRKKRSLFARYIGEIRSESEFASYIIQRANSKTNSISQKSAHSSIKARNHPDEEQQLQKNRIYISDIGSLEQLSNKLQIHLKLNQTPEKKMFYIFEDQKTKLKVIKNFQEIKSLLEVTVIYVFEDGWTVNSELGDIIENNIHLQMILPAYKWRTVQEIRKDRDFDKKIDNIRVILSSIIEDTALVDFYLERLKNEFTKKEGSIEMSGS